MVSTYFLGSVFVTNQIRVSVIYNIAWAQIQLKGCVIREFAR